MTDRKTPTSPAEQPSVVPSDIPDPELTREVISEGQLPGLPVSSDPLLQPMPHPQNREVPPLD